MLPTTTIHFKDFLRSLAIRLTLMDRVRFVAGDNVYYLGSGYWRARPVYANEDEREMPEPERTKPIGVILINPDRTSDQLQTVTEAMKILI
jgi:hypothetical protein